MTIMQIRKPIPRVVYREFNGGLAQVVKVAIKHNTNERYVVLSYFSNPGDWVVIPEIDFLEELIHENEWVPRFKATDIKVSTIGGILASF